jgi:hypothetical protein
MICWFKEYKQSNLVCATSCSPPYNSNWWDGRKKLKTNQLEDWQIIKSKYVSFEAKH